jgi:hypothetical protein
VLNLMCGVERGGLNREMVLPNGVYRRSHRLRVYSVDHRHHSHYAQSARRENNRWLTAYPRTCCMDDTGDVPVLSRGLESLGLRFHPILDAFHLRVLV